MDRAVEGENAFDPHITLDSCRHAMAVFCHERGWERFHTPRNLLLALVGEVGEVAELFQWRGECANSLPDWSAKDREHLGEEVSLSASPFAVEIH